MDAEKLKSYGFELVSRTGHAFFKNIEDGMCLAGVYQERTDDYFLTLQFKDEHRPANIKKLETEINEEVDRELGEENPLSPVRRILTAAKQKAVIPLEVNLGRGYENFSLSLNVEGKNFDELYSQMRKAMQSLGINI